IDVRDAFVGKVRFERDTLRTTDRDHFPHEIEREGPRMRIGAEVERIADVMLDIVTMITNFCHSSSEMSEGISALMSPALQASRKACARFDTLLSNSPKASRSFVPAFLMTPGRTIDTLI